MDCINITPTAITAHLIKAGKILHSDRYSVGPHHIYRYVCTDRRGHVVRFGSAESMAEWWTAGERPTDLYWWIRKALH
jgi:hypothetical protein